MKKTEILRKAIMARRAVAVIGCHDAMSAKVIEACGLKKRSRPMAYDMPMQHT